MTSARTDGFYHAVPIAAPAPLVLAAFFDARALAAWWNVSAVVALPRPLGPYALEWPPTTDRDEVFGTLGGAFHGTVLDYRASQGFLVADAYWLPCESGPVGPMALEVQCSPLDRPGASSPGTLLRVSQRGGDDTPRWLRYYELLGSSWPVALTRLKEYLEHGQGVWDLRNC